ncbi:preprotein translocase subunit SecG [Planctomycetota bacterium]|nr:preprotein translocase subunit SecG [Planctomycetota bacterium]
MMLVILIQKPKGGGLSGAFGGGGGSEGAAFGAKAGDVLTIITIASFVSFLVLAIVLNLIVNSTHDEREKELNGNQTPTAAQVEDDLANEAVNPAQPADTATLPGPAETAAEGAEAKPEVEAPAGAVTEEGKVDETVPAPLPQDETNQ